MNYSAIANSHKLQFTTSRTDSPHPAVFLCFCAKVPANCPLSWLPSRDTQAGDDLTPVSYSSPPNCLKKAICSLTLSPNSSYSWHLGTYRVQNTPLSFSYVFARVAVAQLPNNGRCLQSHYLTSAVVKLLISRSLPSNGYMCHNIVRVISET
jgi:hypothetical protein